MTALRRSHAGALGLAAALAMLVLGACSSSGPPEHAVVEHPELAGKRQVTREVVDPPERAAPFRLTDVTGQPLGTEELRGSVVALRFAYTRCPDVCPLLFAQYLEMQRQLGKLTDEQVALVLVTMDPEWDTPERLRGFSRSLGARWHYLSGARSEMEGVWGDYGVYVTVNPQEIIQHEYKVYLIDREGMIRYRYGGLFATDDAVRDIRALLAE